MESIIEQNEYTIEIFIAFALNIFVHTLTHD